MRWHILPHKLHGEFAPNSAPGIRDTGTVVRAFLPLKEDYERNRLIEYHGYATAVDTRVVCMRPKLTNVSFSSGNGYRVTGLADVEQEPLGLFRLQDDAGSTNYSMSFDCGFAAVMDKDQGEKSIWPLALCTLLSENSNQGIYSIMETEGLEEPGDSYLLVNATNAHAVTDFDGSDVWKSMTLEDTYEDTYTYGDDSQDSDGKISMTLQFTLCMTAFEAQEMEIDATRHESFPPEPTVHWDTARGTYNIKEVQRQLGAGLPRDSTANRGIFDLAPRLWEWPEQPESLSGTGGAFSTTAALWAIGSDDLYEGKVNSAQYSILAYITSSTGDPALALQAYFTMLCAVCYYDRITMFDTAAPLLRVSLVQVTRPLGWSAFIIVACVEVLHLFLVLLVIFIFRRAGNFSWIENAWASISQLLGPTTESWIRDTDTVDDGTVKSLLKDRGLHKTLVRIERAQSHVQLVEKDNVL